MSVEDIQHIGSFCCVNHLLTLVSTYCITLGCAKVRITAVLRPTKPKALDPATFISLPAA